MGLGHLAVTTSSTRCDKICHSARLEKGLVLDICVEHLCKLAHLVKTNADNCRFCVTSQPSKVITKTGANGKSVGPRKERKQTNKSVIQQSRDDLLETVDETAADGDNVLEGTAELDSDDILDNVDTEGRGVKDFLEELTVLLVSVSNRGLAEPLLGNLSGNVGSTEHTGADSQRVLDHVGNQPEAVIVLFDLDPFDKRDGLALGRDLAL